MILATCCFTLCFSVHAKKVRAEETFELSEDYEQYLTGYDISESTMDGVENDVADKYWDYIYFEDDRIYMNNTEIEEKYGANIYDYTLDTETYVTDEEDYYEIAAVRMIRRNLDIMNELVDESYGEITEDGEFVFFESAETLARWRAWDFKLWWNKLEAKFDSDWTILLSIFFLGVHISELSKEMMLNQPETLFGNEETLQDLIGRACGVVGTTLAQDILSNISIIISTALTIISIADLILSNGSVVYKVVQIILKYMIPSLYDTLIVLSAAIACYKGMHLRLCWIPTRKDSWGCAIETI